MIRSLLHALSALFRSRADLVIEILALRQQLAILKTKKPRPRIAAADRGFWILLRRWWPNWRRALIIVQPETVVKWHRRGFRTFWRRKSLPKRFGRPLVDLETRKLIRQIASDNPSWGAPRIHAELRMLGIEIAESTVSRHLPKSLPDPDTIRKWQTFLELHRKTLVGMDFFTVPTVSFQVLHVLFFVHHHRRRVIHWAITKSPTTDWLCQQIRHAFPFDTAPKHLILDRDVLFNATVRASIRAFGIQPKRISRRSPWQNGVAERWVGSVRRELLDHVVVFGRRHLHELLSEYVDYYHDDRPHLSLDKETPSGRDSLGGRRPVLAYSPRQESVAYTTATIGSLSPPDRRILQDAAVLTP